MKERSGHAKGWVIALCVALMAGVIGWAVVTPRDAVSEKGEVKSDKWGEGQRLAPLGPVVVNEEAEGTSQLKELAARVQPKGAVPNQAVLTFASREAMADFLKRAAAEGLMVTGRLDKQRSVRVAYDSLDKLQQELMAHGADISTVGANFPVITPGVASAPTPEQRASGVGTTPFGDALMSAIGAGAEVDRSQWGNGITVAVVDSGVAQHPALAEGQVTHIDLVNDGQPFEGHGTAIASLISGNMDGAQGLAPAAKILDVRIADTSGASDSFQLARGIETALDRGAQVINISMGSYGDAPVVAQAVSDALARGVIIVASTGNEQAGTKDWPAAYSGVISVSGVDASGHLAYFSNAGTPTLGAPAVGIPSAYEQNNQAYLATGDGTSQAAALVSGAAAAILSQGGDVLSTLARSAKMVPASKEQVGAGMLHLGTK